MNALQTILNTIDPQANEPYTPATPADAIPVEPPTVDGCWETHTGTHYADLASVPWQSAGSAVLVPCDGTGPAHGDRQTTFAGENACYVVTTGQYSDYSIVGIYSTKELAELAAATITDANEIEEYELDIAADKLRQGFKPYRVTFDTDWRSAATIRSVHLAGLGIESSPAVREWRKVLHVYCWAKDEVHAAKIANEKRAAYLLENQHVLPPA